MRELEDINKYKPYRDYRGTCKFKSFKDKKMSWPIIEDKYILDNKYKLRLAKENDIDEICMLYREGFPDLYGNPDYDFVFWPDTLKNELQSEKEFNKGDFILIVVEKTDDKKLVGATGIKMNIGNMSINWRNGVIHHQYRGQKIFKEIMLYLDKITEGTGCEYASILAVTFHSITQKVFEELGWNIRGIFPGAVASWNYDDKYYRQYLVYFDKFYNGGEELVCPNPKNLDLTDKVKQFAECLQI